jgi:luciferase-like monooxygenase
MGRFYDDAKMKSVKAALEKEILAWPMVEAKTMFGCPSYRAKGTLFAGMQTGWIALHALTPEQRKRALEKPFARPFQVMGKTMGKWVQLEAKKSGDVDRVIPFLRACYENAMAGPGKAKATAASMRKPAPPRKPAAKAKAK